MRRQLLELAESLPLRAIDLPDFHREAYRPESVRQTRTFSRPDDSGSPIGRFLVERGTVDLLKPAQTAALFREMHWSAFQIRRLARAALRGSTALREGLAEAQRLLSRMEAAEEELFIANRRLIVNCAKPFYWVGPVWISDFLQEGSKALANAIRKFDFTRGTPFYSYAQAAITNRMRNFFRDHVRAGSFGIRPSRDMQAVKDIVDTWRRDYGEDPPDAVVAKIADMPEERVAKVRQYVAQWEHLPAPPVSLDAEIGQDGTELYELVEDPSADRAAALAEFADVWTAVESLPERMREVMRLRFIEGRTLEEIGTHLGLTRARIKQIQDTAIGRLRNMLGAGDDLER